MTDFHAAVAASIDSNPGWFANTEQPVEAHAVERMERDLGKKLPQEFRHFLTNYGCGYVGKINLFSVRPDSEWYLPSRNHQSLPGSFLAISEDEAGGFFGFLNEGAECGPGIFYLYPDEGDGPKPVTPTFNDYIMLLALP